ncbi:hypothetical protein [Streptacidiphilus carbonis]|uniref:hypothetical protein n=1 Tax=Streptacidiphilus carbonis TaxID=105422 RepID=UPI0005AB4F29|nr:hypothetical protein [Streptacidiphilus carbonis]
MDHRHLLDDHAVALTEEIAQWDAAAKATGLSPYVCKASYVCGTMREFVQASGLNFAEGYHLAALFLALDATELLGRAVTGARVAVEKPGHIGASSVLTKGVRYLRDHGGTCAPLPHNPDRYVELRNFAGHGASYLPPKVNFHPDSIRLLLRRLAHALNTVWTDPDLPGTLAVAEIHPVFTLVNGQREPVHVRGIQKHLQTAMPGDGLEHDSWRYDTVSVSAASPTASGTG